MDYGGDYEILGDDNKKKISFRDKFNSLIEKTKIYTNSEAGFDDLLKNVKKEAYSNDPKRAFDRLLQ